MKKILLIADIHLARRGEKVHGIDAAARLDLCVRTINEAFADASLCVLMGDLVETPGHAEYETLRECLTPLAMPLRLLIGNHDNRDVLKSVWPEIDCADDGYVQSRLVTDDGVLLFLDTGETNAHPGEYGLAKQQWLKRELDLAGDAPVYIFMHHPPFPTGFLTDGSRLRDAEAFHQVLQTSRSIKHLFVGHMHRAASGNWRGYSWTSLHGTCYENNFRMLPLKPHRMAGPAQIGLALLDRGDVVVHFHDVLEPYPVIGYR